MSIQDSSENTEFHTDSAQTWHRVHPASPAIRGWIAIVAVMVVLGRSFIEQLVQSTASRGERGGDGLPVWIVLLVIAAAVLVFGVGFVFSWFFTRYQVTDDHVRINSGFIFRQQRQARIDRVQAIDVVQPLLARIFNLAELKFEVADAGKSAMRLSFLKVDEAKRLRAAILARAAGVRVDPEHPSQVQEAPEQQILQLSPGRIIGATVFSVLSVSLLIVSLGLVVLVILGWWGALIGFLPVLLGLFAGYWNAFSKDFNFRIALSPDGVRLHYGLLETRSQTIPPGRVQAVSINQGLIWRIFGWYRIQLNVAGYGNEGEQNRSTLLPVGTVQEVLSVLSLVFPDPGVENPQAVFEAGLRGSAGAEGFQHSPPRAAWLGPFVWRRNAYRATRTALLCRHGVLTRRLQVVPHERTQSLQLKQGLLQRWLGLVDFELHSTPGPIRPLVRHLDLQTGRDLFSEQGARAATARRIAQSEHWMQPRPPEGQ
ncbi:PH domain-containing protein [Psychromicrobium sp. YIM B11713]|uniref:PH domain-containing protein n=1 Tax=Psychromicrobium sp. YIM B11713 TaxID=3145233 RepID=UPI00374F7050